MRRLDPNYISLWLGSSTIALLVVDKVLQGSTRRANSVQGDDRPLRLDGDVPSQPGAPRYMWLSALSSYSSPNLKQHIASCDPNQGSSPEKSSDTSSFPRTPTLPPAPTTTSVSSWRLGLYRFLRVPLPHLPRQLYRHDPVWTLTRAQRRQRSCDETTAHQLLSKMAQSPTARDGHLADLQKQWLETVYGPGVTLPDRQVFLERYGCTGWTDAVLQYLVHDVLSHNDTDRSTDQLLHCGFVEMGAGNGQWARALTDRYHHAGSDRSFGDPTAHTKYFEFVLAYDNFSQIPLKNPTVYHARSAVATRYFYKVQPLRHLSNDTGAASEESIHATLQQWPCRGRILLLVYPPADSDMAVDSVRAYDTIHQSHHRQRVFVYVGEGRGGANANDAFFDYMEHADNGWILVKVMDVQSFGSKGFEKLYVFRKSADG